MAAVPGGVLASGAVDADVRLWRAGQCIHVLQGHASPVSALVVLPGGLLASAGQGDEVRLWI